jgi:WhiB family redox-sensing transcriptional regulator
VSLDFRTEGLCAQTDPEAFYPDSGVNAHAAKAVCRACPVIEACREHALTAPEPYGVWGGLSERERQALRRDQGRPRAISQRGKAIRAAVARMAGEGKTKSQIGRVLKLSGTTINRYLADTGTTPGRAA